MDRDAIVRAIKSLTGGMKHSDREWLGMDLYEAAAAEKCELLRCDRGTATLWLQPEAGAEKNRLLGLAMRGKLDAAGQEQLLGLLRQEKGERSGRAGDEPLTLTAAEQERLRFHGHDPRVIERMHEVHSLDDYKRVVAQVKEGA